MRRECAIPGRPGAARGADGNDITLDDPHVAHVRAVPRRRLRAVIPGGRIDARRVTLAPPIGRHVVRLHPAAWRLFNLLPLLRTHVLAWVGKRA